MQNATKFDQYRHHCQWHWVLEAHSGQDHQHCGVPKPTHIIAGCNITSWKQDKFGVIYNRDYSWPLMAVPGWCGVHLATFVREKYFNWKPYTALREKLILTISGSFCKSTSWPLLRITVGCQGIDFAAVCTQWSMGSASCTSFGTRTTWFVSMLRCLRLLQITRWHCWQVNTPVECLEIAGFCKERGGAGVSLLAGHLVARGVWPPTVLLARIAPSYS